MNAFIESPESAIFQNGEIIIVMQGGNQVRFPVAFNPWLALGTPQQLSRMELSPFGIHWPDLNEDLSFPGLLAGDFGQVK